MGRGKTPVGFIEDKRKRDKSFETRRAGLLSKAQHLSTLCRVPVAVVCADPDGGAPTVMETEQGVFERYRALPEATRAEHTHLKYLDGLLKKERAKLARKRQAGPPALAPPHAEMGRMTLDELRDLLQSVDKALEAATERRIALGLPLQGADDAVVVPVGDSGPPTAGGSESDAGNFHPMQQGQAVDQPMIWPGLQAQGGGMIPREHYYGGMNMVQPAYEPQSQYNIGNGAVHLGGYQQPMLSNGGNYRRQLAPEAYFQPRNAIAQPWHFPVRLGGYQQQMPSNGGNGNYHTQLAPGTCFQPHNAIAQPWNGGFQYNDGSSSHVGTSSSWMQLGASNGNFNNGVVQDPAIWSPAESSNTTTVYPYMTTSGSPPAPEYPDQFTGDNSFADATPEFVDMGAPGNGMNNLGGHETQGSSNDLQMQYSAASQSSSCVRELFGYGSDD